MTESTNNSKIPCAEFKTLSLKTRRNKEIKDITIPKLEHVVLPPRIPINIPSPDPVHKSPNTPGLLDNPIDHNVKHEYLEHSHIFVFNDKSRIREYTMNISEKKNSHINIYYPVVHGIMFLVILIFMIVNYDRVKSVMYYVVTILIIYIIMVPFVYLLKLTNHDRVLCILIHIMNALEIMMICMNSYIFFTTDIHPKIILFIIIMLQCFIFRCSQ
jgi:hypothetical protein